MLAKSLEQNRQQAQPSAERTVMTEQKPPPNSPDPERMTAMISEIGEQSQRLVSEFLARQNGDTSIGMTDSMNIASTFMEMTKQFVADPVKAAQAQAALWQGYMDLWQSTTTRMLGGDAAPRVTPAADDRRFKDSEWQENLVFDHIKQAYLLTSRWMRDTVHDVEGMDDKTAAKVDFHTRQFVDAMAPTNFAMSNPQVLRATMESGGENLVKGLKNLLDDLERGDGQLSIKMTDTDAFEVGGNIATTPGKVVYQNDLMQLIQYAPTTETVHKRPLLIVPPWINKFYILDLREKNSFIKWAVSQGLTVFVVSWVNPDADLASKSFEDYMLEGPVAALDAIEQATGEREVNAIGYCIGGTLMAATLAYLTAKGDERVQTITFFTTMVDFEDPGELGVFIDEEQISALEARMDRDGYLDGSAMSTTFNMMRANDLIWSFVVNNYLLGKDPFPFDLLYWNSDSTRMPAAMHGFYLRKMYHENRLIEAGGIELDGVPIDLRSLKIPTFILSTKEDHIAPWTSTYQATQLYKGSVRFCLAGSGHIAGVVNPPVEPPKYGFYTNTRKAKTAEKWLDGATWHDGSWWPDWEKWLSRHGGGKVSARTPGDGALPAIEDAPGSYVKVTLKD
jgi:polyhydroxyalkanoate synthase subunit PhaC